GRGAAPPGHTRPRWPRAGSDWLTRAETKCPFPVVGRRWRLGRSTDRMPYPQIIGARGGIWRGLWSQTAEISAAERELEEDCYLAAGRGPGDLLALLCAVHPLVRQHITREQPEAH